MLSFYLVVNVLTVLILLGLGLAVILNNYRAKLNLLFLFFTIATSCWLISNNFSNSASLSAGLITFANHLVLFFSSLSLFLLGQVVVLIANDKFFLKHARPIAVINLLIALLTLTPLVITGSTVHENISGIIFGPLAFTYFLTLTGNAAIVFISLVRGLKRSSGNEYARLLIILYSLVIAIGITLIMNAVIPFIFNSFSFTNIGALSAIFGTVGIAYTIIRHQLFNVRLVVARSATYLLLLVSLSAIFAGIVFTITSIFFSSQDTSTGVKVTYLFVALAMSLILQPLKRFFDRSTNKLFYRDAYDSQELLNDLNRSLVTTIDLKELLSRSSKIIGETLKTEYCTFAIREAEKDKVVLTSTEERGFDQEALQGIFNYSKHLSGKTVVAEELEAPKSHLKELMQKNSIAILIKLEGRIQGHVQHPGYILLGQKKSGGLFSAQDIQILEIIADELVIAIQNALRFEEIQQFNITLQEKIEAATRELRRSNAKLKALDEAKDEFISMASHQLRTPLTSIKGYLSMVLEGDAGPIKRAQKDMIQQSFDGAQRMVYLIADLLNVSRLQTGKFVIENQPTNLAEVIVGEITQLREQIANREIELVYEKPDKFPILNLDETKIRQVIMNFLDNALYYTPKGGKVTVKLEAAPSTVSYTVTDTGVGVPKAVQHSLFTKFYRADNARKMRPDGTGLGLFMAKKVIVAQGGAIIFNSEEGKGSTFGFSFPRAGLELKGASARPHPALAEKH